ncbi:MAG: hypothetical protein ACKO38_00620, partial [Planctomycetota bacterium]
MSARRWFAVVGVLLSAALGCGLISIVNPKAGWGRENAAQQAASGQTPETAGEKVEADGANSGANAEEVAQEGGAAEQTQDSAARAKQAPAVEIAPRPDREPYRGIETAEVEQARRTLRDRLNGFLHRIAADPAAVRDGWKRFVQTELIDAAAKSTAFDPSSDKAIRARLFSDKAGMEFSPVLALRRAYEEFAELQQAVAGENPADAVGRLQDESRRRLELFQSGEAPYESSEIGTRIAQLRRLKQAPKLVEEVDSRFNRENLFVRATQKLIAVGVDQDVDETSAVTDSILGVSVFGDARLRGRVTLGLLPSDDRGRFELRLDGQALSSSTGYRGKVTLYSTSTTAVMARKSIELDDLGLRGGATVAACTTDNSLNDIDARCCLVERIAWKKAQQSQGQAEAIASASAERRIESRMDDRAASLLANANGSYQNKVRKPLLRRDGFPQSLRFQTTAEHLLGRSLQRNPSQLAAATDPPAAKDGGDLAVRVHESYVRNMGESALGGYRLTDVELEKLYKDNGREVPEELRVTETSTRWGFTFTRLSPIEIAFRDNQMRITVTCFDFAQGEQVQRPDVRRALRFIATYKFEEANGKAEFVRQEQTLNAEYVPVPGRLRESLREVAVKRFMAKKFDAMLKKRFPADFALPGRWAAGGQLVAKDCQPVGEWLSMNWNLAPLPPAEAKSAEAKPAEAKPAEAKPAEAKPTEVKPTEVKPAEAKPAEVKPAEVKPAEVKPAEVKPAEVKSADEKP